MTEIVENVFQMKLFQYNQNDQKQLEKVLGSQFVQNELEIFSNCCVFHVIRHTATAKGDMSPGLPVFTLLARGKLVEFNINIELILILTLILTLINNKIKLEFSSNCRSRYMVKLWSGATVFYSNF